jgi:hypothetical protein
VDAAAGDVVEARDSILLLEFTAVPVGRVRHDQVADKKTVRCGLAWTTRSHPHDVFLFRVAQHARPAAFSRTPPSSPFLRTVQVNVGSECLEFKGRGRVKRKS